MDTATRIKHFIPAGQGWRVVILDLFYNNENRTDEYSVKTVPIIGWSVIAAEEQDEDDLFEPVIPKSVVYCDIFDIIQNEGDYLGVLPPEEEFKIDKWDIIAKREFELWVSSKKKAAS